MNKLSVFINQDQVGCLWLDAQHRFCFQYHPDWLAASHAYPLSISLPLMDQPFINDAAYAYFTNLLPEGQVLTALTRRLGIAESDKFNLLRAVGGDCAGAVSLHPWGTSPPSPEDFAYDPLTQDLLLEKIHDLKTNPFLVAEERRLSLAGAMEKLPVRIMDETVCLPCNGAPTTHIIKTPVEDLQGVITNETYCMTLAREMGLNVPRVEILKIHGMALFAVERYDREIEKDTVTRLVQEDFCQALNKDPQQKYNLDLNDYFQLLRDVSAHPAQDIKQLLQWLIFNGLIGNADCHAKNISLLHRENGTRLAPFYDLVSTHMYREFTKKMPMKIADKKRDFRHLQARHFESLAQEIGLKPDLVINTAREWARAIKPVCLKTGETFKAAQTSVDMVDRINALIHNHADAVLDALG